MSALASTPVPSRFAAGWRPRFVHLAWIVVAIAIVHPPHGLGSSVCWMRAATGVPCPGCGMTRAVSCAGRGMFAESMAYHPFGAPMLALSLAVVAGTLLPGLGRRADELQAGHPRATRFARRLLVTAFLGFGVARAILHFVPPGAGGI